MDTVDVILAQWARERPDLDVSPMGPIGRLKRCAMLMQPKLDRVYADQFGLSSWAFDMLATLRRAGKPYCLAPTTLFSSLMVTSGTMTHRLNSLEKSGLISRRQHDQDARSMLVQLTPKGLALIERAVQAHVDNERDILSGLTQAQLRQVDEGLKLLLRLLEPGTEKNGTGTAQAEIEK